MRFSVTRSQLLPYVTAAALGGVIIAVTTFTATEPPAESQTTSETGPAVVNGGVPGAATQSDGRKTTAAGPVSGRGPAAGPAVAQERPGANYDVGVTDTQILIGGSTFTSGPAAVYGEQIAVGFQAGVNYINDHGGINGRRVVAKLYDDGGDPAKQLANTKRLIEVDKVFALSQVYAPISGEYVSQKRVPVFHLGQFNEEFTNPWWFSVGGAQRTSSYALADFGVNWVGAKSAAIFYIDAGVVNYSRAYAELVKKDWESWGAKVPVMYGFAPDQTSCSDALGQARSAGVEFIAFEIDASKVINCGVEAQIQGYKPPKGWGGYLIGVPVIHEALGDYSIGMFAFDAFGDLYNFKPYQDAVRRVSSKTEWYSSVTAAYFMAALLMRDGIAKLGDNITRERLRNVLNTFTNWRPAELAKATNFPTWTWRPECHLALKGGYAIQIKKHESGELKWTQVTPQIPRVALPPGQQPPADFARCDAFARETVFGKFKK